MAGEADAFVLLCLAFILPPAAVAFLAGCGVDLCINILLTILAYLPGCIHAFWLVLKRTEANEKYGYGNWTYSGMGEYHPRTQRSPGQYGPGQPPPNQPKAPVDQKPEGPGAPPAPAEQQYSSTHQPPPGQPDQKYSYQPPPPAESTAQTAAPPSGT